MSPHTLIDERAKLLRIGVGIPQEPRSIPNVSVVLNEQNDVWDQFSDAVRYDAATLGFTQPNTDVRERRPILQTVGGVVVAPGIIVTVGEYEERYGGIDLGELRGRMTPGVYKAFVRYIGSIRGREDLDVNVITEIPD
jgi:hypothetical protein